MNTKPHRNNHWKYCVIEEDYCLNQGHGEQFFSAFDRAFKIPPVKLQSSQVSKGKADELKHGGRKLHSNGKVESSPLCFNERELANKPHYSRYAGLCDIFQSSEQSMTCEHHNPSSQSKSSQKNDRVSFCVSTTHFSIPCGGRFEGHILPPLLYPETESTNFVTPTPLFRGILFTKARRKSCSWKLEVAKRRTREIGFNSLIQLRNPAITIIESNRKS